MEQTQSFFVGNLRQTSSLFVSESAFYLYAYTCGKIYIERTQGCKLMNLRMHNHIYKTKIQPFDIFSPGRTNSLVVSTRRLKHLIIQFKVLNINCHSFSHLSYTQSEQLNIRISHSHRYNSADLQIANKPIIEAFKTL